MSATTNQPAAESIDSATSTKWSAWAASHARCCNRHALASLLHGAEIFHEEQVSDADGYRMLVATLGGRPDKQGHFVVFMNDCPDAEHYVLTVEPFESFARHGLSS